MEIKYNDWAIFFNESAAFAETFRQEMAKQLLERFYSILEVNYEIKRSKFQLTIGLHPLNIMYENDYAFATVYISNPHSLSIPVTAYWITNNHENLKDATNLDIWNKENIEFGWCTDFDKNDYTEFLEPRNVLSKELLSCSFDYEYDYALYPDLSFTICFSQKVFEEDLKEIEYILSATIKDTYISELTNEEEKMESNKENETEGFFDFQDNDFEIATEQLVEAIKKIGHSKVGELIDKIIVE